MPDVQLILGDSLAVLPTLEAGSVDAVCTDPPAGISFMSKNFDTFRGRDHFIDFLASVMTKCLRALKPGGYAFVWALPRTSHWTATALEDAGFEIRDRVAHIFGQGFPKGKGCLKPAVEDWWLARKPGPKVLPLPGLDECRVGLMTPEEIARSGRSRSGYDGGWKPLDWKRDGKDPAGRYPPNLVLTHDSRCERIGTKKVKTAYSQPMERTTSERNQVCYGKADKEDRPIGYADTDGLETVEDWRCHEQCPVRLLGEQSGEMVPSFRKGNRATHAGRHICRQLKTRTEGRDESGQGYTDSGSCARFFPQFHWSAADDVPFLYCSKASRREREAGLEGLPKRAASVGNCEAAGRDSANPNNYNAASKRRRVEQGLPATELRANTHPCVKPLALMCWLVRLITPPGGLCLDPFLGSGTTALACLREGRRCIGIESDEEYFQIAQARLQAAQNDTPLFREEAHA